MPESAGGESTANDATIDVLVNAEIAAHQRQRLWADVIQCRRVLDELVAGQAGMKAKAVQVAKVYDSKAREVEKMITAARKAVKDAETALKEGGS